MASCRLDKKKAMISTALLTDHYELTMLDGALQGGLGERPAAFECFARRLPDGRRYGVVAGLGRLVDAIRDFRFDEGQLGWLGERGFLHDDTVAWLADYRFSGDLDAYREGELFFPYSPILTATGTFAETVVLETLVLSVLNHDSAIASAAARMAWAAQDRPLLEFGSRRTHEWSAVAAARAAYVAGFDATSNLEAGRRYGIPTLGTVAHAFVMIHDDEEAAFRTQVRASGEETTILVDTYDIPRGIRRAIAAGGTGLDSIRIDSGDLAEEAGRARALLDELGATGTRIIASGDLDEYALHRLRPAPIDAYGVGTQLVTGSGHPTAGLVYKLVARGDQPGDEPTIPEVKTSSQKATVGGRKRAARILRDGVAVEERLTGWHEDPLGGAEGRPLQVPVIRGGEVVHDPSYEEIRAHHRRARAELPAPALELDAGSPAVQVSYAGALG